LWNEVLQDLSGYGLTATMDSDFDLESEEAA
jgi:hypothetical protein